MTDWVNQKSTLYDSITQVGAYGSSHQIEYFCGCDFDRNKWQTWQSGIGYGDTGSNATFLSAKMHRYGGVRLTTAAEQWNTSWIGMGAAQVCDKDGFGMISMMSRIDSSDAGTSVGMTSNGNQQPRQTTNDASRIEFVCSTNPATLYMRCKQGSGGLTELWTSQTSSGAAGTKLFIYQIEGFSSTGTTGDGFRGSIDGVLEVTKVDSSNYPDENMSPFASCWTRANSSKSAIFSYSECWNTGV